MKTILQISPRLHTGGLEQGTIDVAIASKMAGFRSIVVSGGGHLEKILTQADIQHLTLPVYQKSPLAIRRNSRLLREYIQEQHVDLVHARSRAPIWATHFALKNQDIPLITSCHSPHSIDRLRLKKYYNRSIIYGDRVIAISQFIADYLEKNYTLPTQKIKVVYRGIDTDRFHPNKIDPEKLNSFKQQWKIPQDKLIIMIPGRITRWKGQDIFLEAIAKLKNKIPVFGVMIGRVDSPHYFKELQEIIAKNQLHDHIKHIDDYHDMPYAYALADMTVSASRKPEAFGRVAVEAQTMQSLVIASNLGAAKETVLHGKTGFLIAPDNAQALAQAIEHAYQLAPEERENIKQNAFKRSHQLFTKTRMTDETMAVYEQALAKAASEIT